ncbi:hypothetical protein Tco_1290142 [Tanacetum coccineum]
MHTFYQPYQHDYQLTKDHPLEQVIGEPSRQVLTRNQLRTNGEMCIYALSVSTMEPSNVNEAITDPGWIDSMQEKLLQFKRLDPCLQAKEGTVWVKSSTKGMYDELSKFILQNNFSKGTIDPTLFAHLMKSRFEMSMMREMMFFLGLQVNQSPLWHLHKPVQLRTRNLEKAQPTEKHLKEITQDVRTPSRALPVELNS